MILVGKVKGGSSPWVRGTGGRPLSLFPPTPHSPLLFRRILLLANGKAKSAAFLTASERAEVARRLSADHGSGPLSPPLPDGFGARYVRQALVDWKIYVHMAVCMAGFCPIYSFALFSPTIVKGMGYAANEAQLMSVPPYVCACAATIAASWGADRLRRRGAFLCAFQLVAALGFALLAASADPGVQYAGLVVAAIGK